MMKEFFNFWVNDPFKLAL